MRETQLKVLISFLSLALQWIERIDGQHPEAQKLIKNGRKLIEEIRVTLRG